MFLCRSKVVLNNTISKLERKINELSDQLEEEHKISNEQKDLVRFIYTLTACVSSHH